ncbi:LAME_0G17986g1_1 [Lachancea meyersii CBS 8951]|uniref:LAME_0G17986g1_1 n=1 Tax=Lachancea meyersii CBS 8951 TaxID=1266667 RepID=A0A1G4KBQ2_9SACH|nr:LAME_0G17986g1_1 [Lachancea meyersii CBS 8951]
MFSLQQNVNTSLGSILGILKEQLDSGQWPNCTVRMLNSGNLTLQDSPGSPFYQQPSNVPAFFLQCADEAGRNLTEVYSSLMSTLIEESTSPLANGSAPSLLIGKNPFSSAILLIAFAVCAVCAGSWMLLIVLLLLPANNHNSGKKMVYLGVTYSAIFHTVVLSKSMHSIFEKQYEANYQNSQEFDEQMLDSTLFNVMLFFTVLISNLNWIDIVYYMFHNYRKTQRKWIPRILSNRNRQILAVGLTLTGIQALVMGLRLWAARRNTESLGILLRVVDLVIYTAFTLSVTCFVWRNYGFTLRPKTLDQQLSWWGQFKVFWNDYHELALLLVYNAAVMALLYGVRIFTSVISNDVCKWLKCIIIFLNVLVTVNTWGLIGVLEQRERTFSKETVLGRKINNRDRFFVDPNISYGNDDCLMVEDGSINSQNASLLAGGEKSGGHKGDLKFITKPARALKSKLRGRKGDEDVNIGLSSSPSSKGVENETPQEDQEDRSWLHGEHDWAHDNESTETLLTRNYIFNHEEG